MRIDPKQHGWMTAPETVAVMTALVGARFVGGAVRNALLGAPVVDIDIAVPMPPGESLTRLSAAGIKTIATGLDHGTVTAIAGSHSYEITSLRRDVASDGRHATVCFTDDWAEDAVRRDFTFNALYAGTDGEIFDYATGVDDLIAGRVRFMGDPAARIAEDYLRILRLFRFHAWYGRGEMDEAALRAAAAAKDSLATLSAERVAKEMLRLLEAPNPAPVLRVMAATGILSAVVPAALDMTRLERFCEIDGENLFTANGVLRLAALLMTDQAEAVGERLKLSNADRARLRCALGGPEKIVPRLSVKEVRRLLYKIGPASFEDRVRLKWAGAPKSQPAIQWRMLLAMAGSWERPKFPLTGADVMNAGVPQGAGVGRILAQLEAQWTQEDFATDESVLRQRLLTLIASDAWKD